MQDTSNFSVQEKMGVQSLKYEEHNKVNKTLIDGAVDLGFKSKSVPQNVRGDFNEHRKCGASCTYGCRGLTGEDKSSGKNSGEYALLNPILRDSGRDGRPVIKGFHGFEVDRILFDEVESCHSSWQGDSVCRQSQHPGHSAKKWAQSEFTSSRDLLSLTWQNKHIGQHFHAHPTVLVHSIWPEPVNPWEGTILTSLIDDFWNQDGKGHGVKLEAMCMVPGLFFPYVPWKGNQDWKAKVQRYPNVMGNIVLCREESTGSITIDKNGKRIINYTIGDKEKGWILNGIQGLAKVLHSQGALEIYMATVGGPVYKRPDSSPKGTKWSDDKVFVKFLSDIKSLGLNPDRAAFGSAHQMGTCRMSGSSKTGAVDLRGKVWDTEGLYVADASVFPSASGVNPMITTMAFGEWIGRRLGEEVGKGSRKARL